MKTNILFFCLVLCLFILVLLVFSPGKIDTGTEYPTWTVYANETNEFACDMTSQANNKPCNRFKFLGATGLLAYFNYIWSIVLTFTVCILAKPKCPTINKKESDNETE